MYGGKYLTGLKAQADYFGWKAKGEIIAVHSCRPPLVKREAEDVVEHRILITCPHDG
jgi:hypothetical protein